MEGNLFVNDRLELAASSTRWLWLPLLVAAISLTMATVDLLAALMASTGTDLPTFGDLALPGLIVLLSIFTLRLGIPLLRTRDQRHTLPRWMGWLALLLGAAAAVLSGAELLNGIVKEGIVAFLDFPVVMFVVLGLSCGAVALFGFRNQSV
jgi:hypothetical protein